MSSIRKAILGAPPAMAVALICLFSSCSSTETGYSDAQRSLRKDCKADEIVGVWTLREHSKADNEILLFRADGTGRDRNKIGAAQVEDRMLVWHYEGNGMWTGEETGAAIASLGDAPTKPVDSGWRGAYTMCLSGEYLLCEVSPKGKRTQKLSASQWALIAFTGPYGFILAPLTSHGTTTRKVFVRA